MQVLHNDFPKLMVSAVLGPSAAPADVHTADHRRHDTSYVCPCYVNSRRSNEALVMTVILKSDDPPSKWILRGVALLCGKDA